MEVVSNINWMLWLKTVLCWKQVGYCAHYALEVTCDQFVLQPLKLKLFFEWHWQWDQKLFHFGLSRQKTWKLSISHHGGGGGGQLSVFFRCCAALWHSYPARPVVIVQLEFNSFLQGTLTDHHSSSGNKKNSSIFILVATQFWQYPVSFEGDSRRLKFRATVIQYTADGDIDWLCRSNIEPFSYNLYRPPWHLVMREVDLQFKKCSAVQFSQILA